MLLKNGKKPLDSENTTAEIKTRLGAKVYMHQRVIERELNFFGHVCRVNNKTVVPRGTMESPHMPSRPKRDWVDDVQEWCNMDIYSSYRTAQYRVVVSRCQSSNGH